MIWLIWLTFFWYADEKNVYPLFESLDRVEKILEGKKYLIQDTFTEADIRLFTTIVRYIWILSSEKRCHTNNTFQYLDLIPFILVISSVILVALNIIIPIFWSGLVVFTKSLVVSHLCI